MGGLGSLSGRLARLEQLAGEQRVLHERRVGRALRAASDEEVGRLRHLLVVDPSAAERFVRELEGRLGEGVSAPSLPTAVAAELRRRGDPDGGRLGSEWDLLSAGELAEAVELLRGGTVLADGSVTLSVTAERRLERLRRRAELRALLGVDVKACVADRGGCSCLAEALDEVDRAPALRLLGARAVRLLARRLHGRARRGRASGAARRRRRRERLQAMVAARPASLAAGLARVEPARLQEAAPVDEEFVAGPAEAAADVERERERESERPPAAPRRRVRSSLRARVPAGRVTRGDRESDGELVERLFGLPVGSSVDLGSVPPESSLHRLGGAARRQPR